MSRISKQSVRKKLFERDHFVCLCCGSDKSLTLDHIIPIYLGGTDLDENLQTLCFSCNIKKSGAVMTLDELRKINEIKDKKKLRLLNKKLNKKMAKQKYREEMIKQIYE